MFQGDQMAQPKMVWMVADEKHVVCGTTTVCCGRTVRPGQSILFRRVMDGEAANFRVLTFHRRCLISLLMEGPMDQDEQAFEELRQSIVAAGDIFETRS
jgi:hypothetical protein